jgi:hypothetical protein
MSHPHLQFTCLTATAIFFALQFFPNWFTRILATPVVPLYSLAALALAMLTAVGVIVSLAFWYSSSKPATKSAAGRWCLTFCASLGCIFALSLANSLYGRGLPMGSFTRRFDRATWTKFGSSRYVQGDITERQKMLGNAIHSEVRGKTKAEILESLGPSESSFGEGPGEISYLTGPERSSFVSIDSETLIIHFDQEGRATGWRLHND